MRLSPSNVLKLLEAVGIPTSDLKNVELTNDESKAFIALVRESLTPHGKSDIILATFGLDGALFLEKSLESCAEKLRISPEFVGEILAEALRDLRSDERFRYEVLRIIPELCQQCCEDMRKKAEAEFISVVDRTLVVELGLPSECCMLLVRGDVFCVGRLKQQTREQLEDMLRTYSEKGGKKSYFSCLERRMHELGVLLPE